MKRQFQLNAHYAFNIPGDRDQRDALTAVSEIKLVIVLNIFPGILIRSIAYYIMICLQCFSNFIPLIDTFILVQ